LEENEKLNSMKDEKELRGLDVFKKNYVMLANKIIDNLKKRLIAENQVRVIGQFRV
jgi:hypothetical protein